MIPGVGLVRVRHERAGQLRESRPLGPEGSTTALISDLAPRQARRAPIAG